MYLKHSEALRDIELDLEEEKLKLGDFPQISFDSKEDLLRKVLRSYREGISKPPYYPPPSWGQPSLERLSIPRVNYEITQRVFTNPLIKRQLPSVGFNLFSLN